MRSTNGVVDLIERANDAIPYCPCGTHTTPIWRDGIVWLECATLANPPAGRVHRLLNAMAPHVHQEIVDLGDAAIAA